MPSNRSAQKQIFWGWVSRLRSVPERNNKRLCVPATLNLLANHKLPFPSSAIWTLSCFLHTVVSPIQFPVNAPEGGWLGLKRKKGITIDCLPSQVSYINYQYNFLPDSLSPWLHAVAGSCPRSQSLPRIPAISITSHQLVLLPGIFSIHPCFLISTSSSHPFPTLIAPELYPSLVYLRSTLRFLCDLVA